MKPLLLRIVLVATGVMMCLSAVTLFLPETQLENMVRWFLGPQVADELWQTGPAFDYVLRVCMAGYLWVGVVLLVTATNPVRHKPQILVAIGALSMVAVVCLVAGIVNKLPVLWYLGDAIPCLVAAILLAVLRPGKAQA